MTIEAILDDVLRREGGYSDHLADGGGPTNYGITANVLGQFRQWGRRATRAEVQQLTEAEAREIYHRQFVSAPRLDRVPDERLMALLVDFGVHSGPMRAVKALQHALDVPMDGVIGRQTLTALAGANAEAVYRSVLRERGELLAAILHRDSTQRIFAAGWLRRLMEFV